MSNSLSFVKISQKRLRFDNKTGTREFMKFAKKYHQQIEAEQASIGKIVHAMSPPKLADIGAQTQEATHDWSHAWGSRPWDIDAMFAHLHIRRV